MTCTGAEMGKHPAGHETIFKFQGELHMSNSVYKLIELVGVSEQSWEDAASRAIEKASESLKDLRIAEVRKMDVKIQEGKPMQFRTNLRVSFKYLD